jgi:tetratricopeptide (TPR) repeat protein
MAEDLLTHAQHAYQAGQLEESEAAFEQLAQSTGDQQADGLYGLGVIRFQRGDMKGAESCFRSVVSQEPQNSNAFFFLGEIADREGQSETAISCFALALASTPTHAGARIRIAALLDGGEPQPNLTDRSPAPPPPPPPPQSAPATKPPHLPVQGDSYVGVVRNVQKSIIPWRGKGMSWEQLTFLLEIYDDAGHVVNTMSVEMRGTEVHGLVLEGHWVEINRREKEVHGSLEPKRIRNLTTGAEVRRVKRIFYNQ